MKIIPYAKHFISEEDLESVNDVLKSDFLTQGPKIEELEKQFSNYVGSKYSIAVSSGTAALHLCALSLNVNSGDRVLTTPLTFVASANCIKYCGGDVSFIDIDPNTYLMSIDKLLLEIKNKPRGFYKGIVIVNFAGRVNDLSEFRNIADEYDLWIIEDACHSPGGYFLSQNNQKIYAGSGEYSDLTIFSFHPVKHLAGGEGGLITTNDEQLYKRIKKLRTHGITKDSSEFINSTDSAIFSKDINEITYPNWYMEMQELGYNYRISDIHSALILSQLLKADIKLKQRKKIAKKYYDAFNLIPEIIGQSGIIKGHAYHLYVIEAKNRYQLYNFLRENGIYAQIHYYPCHLMPFYRKLGWGEGDLPFVEKYYENCISLPMFPELTIKEQNYVINKIKEFYKS